MITYYLGEPKTIKELALYEVDEITRRDLDDVDMLLLADGHCLADQGSLV